MKDAVSMRVEFDIGAQKCLNQVIINNQHIEQQLEAGIKKAFENFNFEDFVAEATVSAIQKEIKESLSWGKLREIARKKADEIVNNYIDREMESLKKQLEHEKTT